MKTSIQQFTVFIHRLSDCNLAKVSIQNQIRIKLKDKKETANHLSLKFLNVYGFTRQGK